jgi:hypothetical protein
MARRYTHGRSGVVAGALLAGGGWLAVQFARGVFRFRWQLTPVLVAVPMPLLGWITALTYLVWPGWTLAAYGVAGACAVVWVWQGLQRLYDRVLGAVVAVLCLGWMLAVALSPGVGALYGLWLLGWPVVGLFWWCGGAFRSGRALAQLRKRWDNIAELAGIAKARLIRAHETEVGQVLTVELPGDKTQRDVAKDRLEAAMRTRPGSVHIVKDDKNARRFTLHHVETDPWADGSEVVHPLMGVVAAMAAAADTDRQEAA